MGFKVGLPTMKCSLNPSKQVHAQSGKRSKTCSVSHAWNEMNDDRLGRDPDINKDLTNHNVWMDGDSNMGLENTVKERIRQINEERNAAGLRSLRKDAVSVLQIVEKPPIDYMRKLSYDEQKKFLSDSHTVMKDLLNEWNPQWEVIAAVQHHDELSAHNHEMVLLSSTDDTGIPTMNAKKEVGKSFYRFINENYSKRMREIGYEIEDCRMYDSLSDEEKAERRLHPEGGLDSYEYKQRVMEDAKQELAALKEERENIVKEITRAPDLKSYQSVLAENAALAATVENQRQTITRMKAQINDLKQAVSRLKEEALEWKNKFVDIARKAGSKLMQAFGHETAEAVNQYPDKSVSDGIKNMKADLEPVASKKYVVIPDDQDKTKYRVAFQTDSGYKTAQGGFATRAAAEACKKNLAGAAISLSKKIVDTVRQEAENGISAGIK